MKKVAIFAFSALFALGFASCTKDGSEAEGGVTPTGDELTFVISGATESGITYATVAPETGESTVSTFDVLQFTWDTDEFVDKYDGLTVTTEGTKLKVTISGVTKHATSTQYRYVVVANGSAHTSIAKSALAGKTWAQVKELLTNKNTNAITTPLLITGESTTAAGTTGIVPVTGKRSVARFDILKKADASKKTMDISKVIIREAFQEAPIFFLAAGTATRTDRMNFDVTDGGALTYTAQGALGDVITKSAFYLNPTTVSTSGTTTSISILASFDGGEEKLYHINGPVTISPNYRYTLIANPENLTIELLVADWDDDDEEHYFEGNTGGTFSLTAPVGGTYDAINGLFNVTTNTAASFSLEVPASSTEGFTASITPSHGTAPAIVATPQTITGGITYAAPHYKQTVNVTIPATTDVFSAVLTLTDKAQSGTSFTINIRHTNGSDAVAEDGVTPMYPTPAGDLPAVKIGSVYWAPVNVGATTTDATTLNDDCRGLFFQWGRNVGFYHGNTNNVQGPLSLADANNTSAFIVCITDWLSTPQEDLWTGSNNKGPCPQGWRLPVRTEYEQILSKYNSANYDFAKRRLAVNPEDQNVLYFARTGAGAGDGNWYVGTGMYWTSITHETNGQSYMFQLQANDSSSSVKGSYVERGAGGNVRCVKDVQP